MWKSLKIKLNRPDIYIGVGAESSIDKMFTFPRGPLLPNIPKRIKAAHEAGKWERWSRLGNSSEIGQLSQEAAVVATTSTKG